MNFRLISHVNRDDDLIEAWLQHYLKLGVASFHLICHGGHEQNDALFEIAHQYPVQILDSYSGVFDPYEKRDRLAWGLATLRDGWIVLVDSDEFLELPYRSLATTVNVMRWLGADSLQAPMLQRFAWDGVHVDRRPAAVRRVSLVLGRSLLQARSAAGRHRQVPGFSAAAPHVAEERRQPLSAQRLRQPARADAGRDAPFQMAAGRAEPAQ